MDHSSTSRRRLFIVGAARSGTTVLQNALNDAPSIFLLGEPDLISGAEVPGFVARYNAMHRGWGNQETKSSFCPMLLDHDGSWQDHMEALSVHYQWVGAKQVINPVREIHDLDRFFNFYCRHFYDAHYIFTFRDPLSTILSTRDLQQLTRGETDGLATIMRNVVDIVTLFVRMLRNLPHVRAVFHEACDRAAFNSLEAWLGVPLVNADRYYDANRMRAYSDDDFEGRLRPALGHIRALYDDLKLGTAEGFPTPNWSRTTDTSIPTIIRCWAASIAAPV